MTINWGRADRFTISGRLQLPAGFDVTSLEKQATVSIQIASATGTDTVVLKKYPLGRLGNIWKYKGGEQPPGEGMNLTSLNIWWVPSGKWAGWAGFSASGVLQLTDEIGVNTTPAEATVTLEIPITAGGGLDGEATAAFKVNPRLGLWIYTPWNRLPDFPYDPAE